MMLNVSIMSDSEAGVKDDDVWDTDSRGVVDDD